jgi:FMN phosphatase YigB (HAD superfamily)/membrane-associated phospholipid phosphatase
VPAADETSARNRQRRRFLVAAIAALAALVIIAALVRAHAGGGLDGRILGWFEEHRRQPFTGLFTILDKLDTWWLLGIVVAVIAGALWWSGRMVQAVYLTVTACAALVLNPLLKLVIQRRPPSGDPVVDASVYAFPSGHTTTATAIATAVAVIAWPTRWRWPVMVLAVVFPITMAVSRVSLGVHWPSDVLAGLAFGLAIALTVRLLMPWPSPEEAAAASAADGHGAGGLDPGSTAEGIDVVFLDWGNTLMVDTGMREGPMKDWQHVEAEPGAQEALTRLHARYRLVVATNAEDSPGSDVRLALARVGLADLVDDVVSSADVGDHKPNYAFFRAALLREGDAGLPLDPHRAVMVGDGTTNDVAGAHRAGMRAIWYNPTKRRFPDGVKPPDAVVRKLTDLPAAVDRLAGVVPEKRSRRQRKADADAAADAAAAAASLRAATAAEDAAASAAAAIPNRRIAASEQPAGPTTGR